MPYSVGKYAYGICDKTGFRYPLRELVPEIRNGSKTGLMVGYDVVDPDHPQNHLGRIKIDDEQSLLNARPDRVEPATERLLLVSINFLEIEMGKLSNQSENFKKIQKILTTIPKRDSTLSNKLIDLSEHYTASMLHYSGWWGSHEGDDLRTLPSQFNNSTDLKFDLRGLIQLNSGLRNDSRTANDLGWITKWNKVYPDFVRGIKIDANTEKIHILAGLLLANGSTKGNPAVKIIINYEDESTESFELITKTDVFDFWDQYLHFSK